MDMLSSQKKLRNLRIDMSHGLTHPHPELGQLCKLLDLSIALPRTDAHNISLISELARALQNSPDLTALQLKFQVRNEHKDIDEYVDVYKQIASLNKVRKLSLHGAISLCLESFATFGNMSHLTSLEVQMCQYRTKGFDKVWKALTERRIHLRSICFNMLFMELAFVQYLTSYSGVEELWLSNEEKYSIPDDADIATAFFDAIGRHHADTLRVLEICRYSDESPWRDVPELLNKLAQLQSLRRLRIELPIHDIRTIAKSLEYVSFIGRTFNTLVF